MVPCGFELLHIDGYGCVWVNMEGCGWMDGWMESADWARDVAWWIYSDACGQGRSGGRTGVEGMVGLVRCRSLRVQDQVVQEYIECRGGRCVGGGRGVYSGMLHKLCPPKSWFDRTAFCVLSVLILTVTLTCTPCIYTRIHCSWNKHNNH